MYNPKLNLLYFGFCICFSYDLCLYDQNDDYDAIFIEFGDVKNCEF